MSKPNPEGPRDPGPSPETAPAAAPEARQGEASPGMTFFPIPLAHLHLEDHAGIRFFVRLADGSRFVPYGDNNLTLTARHKEELEQRGIRHIYIQADDRHVFMEGLEQHFEEIVDGEGMSEKEKASILYEILAQRAASILQNPRERERIDPVPALIEPLIRYLADDPLRLAHLGTGMAFTYETHTHSTNVCLLGLALGLRLGLSREELIQMGTGLLLHDVGKAEIDQAILGKQGPLTEDEWTIVREHPSLGAKALEEAGLTEPAIFHVVRHHHERCNGKGYPDALPDREIHLYAKIAALVDVFVALTTERAYRQAVGSFSAVKIMQTQMHPDFCPLLFRELILLLGRSQMNDALCIRKSGRPAGWGRPGQGPTSGSRSQPQRGRGGPGSRAAA